MASLINSSDATFTNATTFVTESTLISTSFFTSLGIDSPEYSSVWSILSTYEIYGWNIMFIGICIFILCGCVCLIIFHLAYVHGQSHGQSHGAAKQKMTMDLHSIPIYEDSDKNKNLTRIYRYDIQFPLYYYIIKFTHSLSILIQYLLIIYYIEQPIFYVYMLLYCYLLSNILFNVYAFCHLFILLAQTIVFLLLCNFSMFGLIIFLSIFIFQITTQCIVGMIAGDFCDFKQCQRHIDYGDSKNLCKYVIENLRFGLIFGNFELFPFLIYFDDDLWYGYASHWYYFVLIFVIWMSSLMPAYIKYMLRFGKYFNPQKHVNHFLIAIYFRMYVIISVLFKFINIYLCVYVILNANWDSNVSNWSFGFYYAMFVAVFNFILILMLPFCLLIYKNCCFGEFKICCSWFVCCKQIACV